MFRVFQLFSIVVKKKKKETETEKEKEKEKEKQKLAVKKQTKRDIMENEEVPVKLKFSPGQAALTFDVSLQGPSTMKNAFQ